MTTHTFEFKDIEKQTFFQSVRSKPNILVQIFCGESGEVLCKAAEAIRRKLPQSVIIGTTTDGEINHGDTKVNSTVIAISVFYGTKLKSAHVEGNDYYRNGVELANALLTEKTKLLILFTDGSTGNGEYFLKGIEDVDNRVVICGGMAGDNGSFTQTYVCEGTTVLKQGAVGVSLNSDLLSIFTNYKFDWSPIGIEHTIDRIEDNRVYEISGVPAVEFYKRYLGEEVEKALPKTGVEFPLIMERNDLRIARAVLGRFDDGSLLFAGNLRQGEKVRLGFGNAEMIMRKSEDMLSEEQSARAQSFFIYSCMARRRYLPNLIDIDMEAYVKNAPTAGFFTYGEFYHHEGHNAMLNQTFTVVGLCENDCMERFGKEDEAAKPATTPDEYMITIGALSHLVERSAHDYEVQTARLQKEKLYSQSLLQSQDIFIKHAVHETNTPLGVIMNNIELYEAEFGKNPYLDNIEAAMKNVYTIFDDLSYLISNKTASYPRHVIDLVDYVRSRIDFFETVARKNGLTFDFASEFADYFIYFNETKLQRIVDNNLTNAIKYTRENKPIKVRLLAREGGCQVRFESCSAKIRNPEKVFEQFYRENEAAKGFGLGLNLVKSICDDEGIVIYLTSDERSTTFCYLFKGDDDEDTVT